MSILIKGMGMPKSCNKCPMTADRYCRIIGYPNGDAINKRYKPLWCPLVEVPTPHGRLIDADAEVTAMYYDEMTEEWKLRTVRIIQVLADCVDDSISTIIEAEE